MFKIRLEVSGVCYDLLPGNQYSLAWPMVQMIVECEPCCWGCCSLECPCGSGDEERLHACSPGLSQTPSSVIHTVSAHLSTYRIAQNQTLQYEVVSISVCLLVGTLSNARSSEMVFSPGKAWHLAFLHSFGISILQAKRIEGLPVTL